MYRGFRTSTRGFGWSDYWTYRYVEIDCDYEDRKEDCYNDDKNQVAAFTIPDRGNDIRSFKDTTFCYGFLDVLKPLEAQFDAIKADKSKQDDVYNLGSQS